MRSLALKVAPLLVLGALACPGEADAQDLDPLFQQGTVALETGRFEDARRDFAAVWKSRKTHDVAANLAQAEVQLGKHRDAAEHLAFALRNFPVTGKPVVRRQIEAMLATEKTHVVALHVRVSSDKADVRVNGVTMGTTPIAEELYAEPGAVTVEAVLDGYEPAKQTFDAKKGESRDVALTLAPTAEPASKVPAVIAFGVGGAGLVVGAIAGGVGFSQMAELKKTCGPELQCPPSESANANAVRTSAHVSTAGFVLAGVGAAVGVTLLLVPLGGKRNNSPSLAVGPTFVGLKGAF